MNDDLFGLALEKEASTVKLAGGLHTGAIVPAIDLEAVEQAYRIADRVCKAVIFEEVPDMTEPEGPDNVAVFVNAAQWAKILGYPPGRLPTVEEATAWIVYHDAKLSAETFYAVEDARKKRAGTEQPAPPRRPPAALVR